MSWGIGVKNKIRKPAMKKRYTKTQMRLSSFPAWESPDFPAPSTLPEVAVEVLDLPAEAFPSDMPLEVGIPQSEPGGSTEPSRYLEGDLRERAPLIFREIVAGLRPFDPWTDDKTPATWRDWFQTHGTPNRQLARLRLSHLPSSRPVLELISDLPQGVSGALGFQLPDGERDWLTEALFIPIYQRGRLAGLEGRLADGTLIYGRHPLAEPVSFLFMEILAELDESQPILLTDDVLWALEEMAMGRPALHLIDASSLQEWWPRDLAGRRIDVALSDGVATPRMRYLLKRLEAWGVEARALTDDIRWSRLMRLRTAGEAGARPGGNPTQLVHRIRGFWQDAVRRWKRPNRGRL